jgi:hypothetical protein
VARETCVLCDQEIEHYSSDLNKLVINDTRSVSICNECIRKITGWQGERLAKLFPTKSLKKYRGRK